jgi:hypothetical protein
MGPTPRPPPRLPPAGQTATRPMRLWKRGSDSALGEGVPGGAGAMPCAAYGVGEDVEDHGGRPAEQQYPVHRRDGAEEPLPPRGEPVNEPRRAALSAAALDGDELLGGGGAARRPQATARHALAKNGCSVAGLPQPPCQAGPARAATSRLLGTTRTKLSPRPQLQNASRGTPAIAPRASRPTSRRRTPTRSPFGGPSRPTTSSPPSSASAAEPSPSTRLSTRLSSKSLPETLTPGACARGACRS